MLYYEDDVRFWRERAQRLAEPASVPRPPSENVEPEATGADEKDGENDDSGPSSRRR